MQCLIHNNMHADHAYNFVHYKSQRFSLTQYPVAFPQFNFISRFVQTILMGTSFSIRESAEEKTFSHMSNAKVHNLHICTKYSVTFLFAVDVLNALF